MSDDEASSQASDTELAPEETLIHGRARRTNAGNRMSILLQAYDAEDVQNDLLADEEEDHRDYVMSDASDVELESTDESDDDGPPKEGEEEKLDGEKEIQRQERVAAKQQKRKAQDLLKMPRVVKKVKMADDGSATTKTTTTTVTGGGATAATRPRKKSERTSWMPTAEDAPTRQSLRKSTVQNKEQTEVKLKESHLRSQKAQELMRIAADKKAADAVPALTQADRVARALQTEKENSKSLNRWVQVEEERREVQRKRMEALRNRQIDGPVVRYWSGSVIWEGDKIKVKRVHEPKVDATRKGCEMPSVTEQTCAKEDKTTALHPEVHEVEAPNGTPTQERPPDPDVPLEKASLPAEIDGHAHTSTQPETDSLMPADQTAHQLEPSQGPDETPAAGTAETSSADPSKEKDAAVDVDPPQSRDDTASRPLPVPAPESGAPPASFLDEIHYWASQPPTLPHARGQDDASPPVIQPTPLVGKAAAQRAASAPEEGASTGPKTLQREQRLQSEQPFPSPSAIPGSRHLDLASQQRPAIDGFPGASSLSTSTTSLLPPQSNVTPNGVASLNEHQSDRFSPLKDPAPTSSSTEVASTLPPSIPLLQEQALRTLLTLDAFPQLEDLPPPIATSTSSRSTKLNPTANILSSVLLPGAHPTLTAAEQKYLTARSLKKKGDNFLPDRPAKALCCITAKEARFRDPKTGLGYRDLAAFKSLQRVIAGGCAWSVYERCWVGIVGDGRMGRVARGVPEGFWSGIIPKPKEKEVVKIEDDAGQAPITAQATGQTSVQHAQAPATQAVPLAATQAIE